MSAPKEEKKPGVYELVCSWSGDGPESSSPGETLTVRVDARGLVQDAEDQEAMDKLVEEFASKISQVFDCDSVQTPKQLEALAKWCDDEMERQ